MKDKSERIKIMAILPRKAHRSTFLKRPLTPEFDDRSTAGLSVAEDRPSPHIPVVAKAGRFAD